MGLTMHTHTHTSASHQLEAMLDTAHGMAVMLHGLLQVCQHADHVIASVSEECTLSRLIAMQADVVFANAAYTSLVRSACQASFPYPGIMLKM